MKTGEAEVITRYRINRKIHAELTTSSESSAADLFYTLEMGGEKNQKDSTEKAAEDEIDSDDKQADQPEKAARDEVDSDDEQADSMEKAVIGEEASAE